MRRLIALAAVAVLVGCDSKGVGTPVLRGSDKGPYTAEGKKIDGRYVQFICPGCGHVTSTSTSECGESLPGQKKICKTKLAFESEYECVNCRGSGRCQGCRVYGAEGGVCWRCGGSGWTRDDVICANCWQSDSKFGKCPICDGTDTCDWCGGSGKLSMDQLEKHSEKPSASSAAAPEQPKPPEEATPPEEEATPPE